MDSEDLRVAMSPAAHDMDPGVAAEKPVEAAIPPSHQALVAMYTALPEPEQRLFMASNPMASIIKGKTRIAEELLRMEKARTAYLLAKVSELQTQLAEAQEVSTHKSRDFGMFTRIELRKLMTSHGPAKAIIDELVARGVSEKALESSRGLSNDDMYKLYCEHPEVGAQFERHCKDALVSYKLLCKDSYTQALCDIEKDNKAWLEFHKEDLLKAVAGGTANVDVDVAFQRIGPSPAAKALANPMVWATPDIPRDPAKAIESVKDAAEKARASLERVKKRQSTNDMDEEGVHKRVMHHTGEMD